MSLISKKKKVELEDNIEENEDIYASFNKANEKEEQTINQEIASQFNHEEPSLENSENMDNDVNESDTQVEESNEDKTTNPFEKKYKKSLEENTKVTEASKTGRWLLVGFYLIFILLGGVAFLMIRSNKYEFYLKNDEVSINTGSSYQVELIPKDIRYFDYFNYDYSIADESIATVDEFGTVTTKAPGTTTLKISLSPGFTSKTMKIISEDVGVDSLSVKYYKDDKLEDADALSIKANESVTLKTVANNKKNLNITSKYHSSDTSVATVDDFGNITGKKEGKVTISSEVNGVTDIITVDVKKESTPVVEPTTPTHGPTNKPTVVPSPNVTKVSIGIASQTTKYVGETLQLSASVEPTSIKNYTVDWESSNPSVATVNNGKITCLKAGTAVITATVNGVKKDSTIVVKNKVTQTPTPATPTAVAPSGTQFTASVIKLDKTSLVVDKNKTATFKVTITKAVGTIKVASSDTSVVKVALPVGDPDAPSCNQSLNTCFLDGFRESDSLTFTVTGVKEGTAYINVIIDDIESTSGEVITGSSKVGILVK